MKTVQIFIFFFLLVLVTKSNAQNFTPSTFGPALWLDASENTSIIHTAGSVSAWNDISGNGNHTTQSNASNKPYYTSANQGIDFDGDDVLIGNNTLLYGSDTTLTLFVAATPNVGVNKGSVIAKGQWTSGSDYRVELGEKGYDVAIQGAREWNSSSNDWNIAHENIFRTYFNSKKEVGYYLNGERVELPRTNVAYNPNNSPFSIGARFNYYNYFEGKIFEVILFQKELSLCEMEQIEGYLAHKWGVQTFVISNHPYKNNPFGICSEIEVEIDENSPNSTVIATIEGSYVNTPVTFSDWRIEDGGIYENTFTLSTTGILTVNDNTHLDFETVSAFNIEVSAIANGMRVYGGVRININDLPDGGTQKIHSELWGVNGEKWDSRGRLADFSHVGYKSGEANYQYINNIVDVTTYGAIPNDGISDAAEIQSAIDNTTSGIIYFPKGKYIVDGKIDIDKDNIVLRGEANNSDPSIGTVLYFPKSTSELGISGSSSSAPYVITFYGNNAGPGTTITESTKMGDRSITVSNPGLFNIGDLVSIKYNGTHPTNGELWDHILNDQNADWACSVAWSNGNSGLMMHHIVERIEGRIITLKEPLRLDLNLNWQPFVQRRTDWYIKNCGFENIFLEHNYVPKPAHLQEPGYNPLSFYRAFNCWINNVGIEHSDNGINIEASSHCEIKNISFHGRAGHHGWTMAYSSNCLAENIAFLNVEEWYHSFTLTHKSNGNVISNVTGVSGIPISTDFHRNTPWGTLITNVQNDWNYNSSGVWCAGPNAGKRTVYWNMGGSGFTSYPNWDDYQTTLVGDMHIPERFHPEKGWHEKVPNILPVDLYIAQLNRRLNLPTDPLFQPDNFIGNRLNWWERDPSRWKVNNVNGNEEYQLFFSETPELTGNRLGEYSVLNSIFSGDHSFSVDAKSLEKLNINNTADLALILNYQDDNNYYKLKVSSDINESGLFKSVNGTSSLLTSINVDISDNNFHQYSLERAGDYIVVHVDHQELGRIYDVTFSGGKIGIGTFNDAVAFDNIILNNSPLAIDLLEFKARSLNNSSAMLEWKTSSETNNDYFSIERSKDFNNWEHLANMDGAGNSNTIISYSMIDKYPYQGISYYRLKQVGFNGQFSYSEIRSINISQTKKNLKIYPNPAKNVIFIEGAKEEFGQIKVYNTLGQNVSKSVIIGQVSEDKYQMSMKFLPSGAYIIRTENTNNRIIKK